jgi:hypothetical protein
MVIAQISLNATAEYLIPFAPTVLKKLNCPAAAKLTRVVEANIPTRKATSIQFDWNAWQHNEGAAGLLLSQFNE